MIHLFNKTEYSPFLQLSELNTQLSLTNQLKYAASAQPTQKSTAFTQLIRRSEKNPQHFYSFNAGLKKTQLLRRFFKKAAEKPAFAQLLRRAAFNFGKGGFPCLNIFCFVFFPVREVSFVKLKINWNRNCSQFSKLESRD